MFFSTFTPYSSHSQDPTLIDFGQNIWWAKEPTEFKDYVFKHWDKIKEAPEILATHLQEVIAEHYDISPESVLLLNGWKEGLNLVAQLYQEKETMLSLPCPEHYLEACKFFKHTIQFSSALLNSQEYRGARLAILSNPNYVNGKVIYADEMEEIANENLDTLFLIDETYVDFNQYVESFSHLVKNQKNIAVLHPLSDKYQLPGLPFAFLLAHKKLIDLLKAYRMQDRLNSISLVAAKFLIKHYQENTLAPSELFQAKNTFFNQLSKLDFLKVEPSYTHYFLAELLDFSARDLQSFLKDKLAFNIREVAHLEGLSKNHFGLITRLPEENQQLIDALQEFAKPD